MANGRDLAKKDVICAIVIILASVFIFVPVVIRHFASGKIMSYLLHPLSLSIGMITVAIALRQILKRHAADWVFLSEAFMILGGFVMLLEAPHMKDYFADLLVSKDFIQQVSDDKKELLMRELLAWGLGVEHSEPVLDGHIAQIRENLGTKYYVPLESIFLRREWVKRKSAMKLTSRFTRHIRVMVPRTEHELADVIVPDSEYYHIMVDDTVCYNREKGQVTIEDSAHCKVTPREPVEGRGRLVMEVSIPLERGEHTVERRLRRNLPPESYEQPFSYTLGFYAKVLEVTYYFPLDFKLEVLPIGHFVEKELKNVSSVTKPVEDENFFHYTFNKRWYGPGSTLHMITRKKAR